MLRERGIVLLKETPFPDFLESSLAPNMLRFSLSKRIWRAIVTAGLQKCNQCHQDTTLSSVTRAQQTLPKSAAKT